MNGITNFQTDFLVLCISLQERSHLGSNSFNNACFKSVKSPLTDVLPSFIRSSVSYVLLNNLGSGFDDLVDFKVFLDFPVGARFLLNQLLEFFLNN